MNSEIPNHLQEASFADLVRHAIEQGFAKDYHLGGTGSWTMVEIDELRNGPAGAKKLGFSAKSVFDAATGKTVPSEKLGSRIIEFFLASPEFGNSHDDPWRMLFDSAFSRARDDQEKSKRIKRALKGPPKHTVLTGSWSEALKRDHAIGKKLWDHITTAQNRQWLFITISPEGFSTFIDDIFEAVRERGVNVDWAFHSDNPWTYNLEENSCFEYKSYWETKSPPEPRPISNCVELQRLTHMSHEEAVTGRQEELINRNIYLDFLFAKWNNHLIEINKNHENESKHGCLNFWESRIFHYYMGFFSFTKDNYNAILNGDEIDEDIIGFVQLYQMLPQSFSERPALFFSGVDNVSKNFAMSSVDFFRRAPMIPRYGETRKTVNEDDGTIKYVSDDTLHYQAIKKVPPRI